MKWLVRGVTAVLMLIAAFYAIGAFVLPGERRITRSVEIAASPAAIFAVVNDMRAFNTWSPWAALDPDTRYEYKGPRRGLGAAMSWSSSNPQVGRGSQLIVASEPHRLVRMRVQYGASQTVMSELIIEPAQAGTRVTWALDAELDSIIQRYVGALILEPAVGSDYERGLANLKTLLERGASS